jgi:hypothetical protein
MFLYMHVTKHRKFRLAEQNVLDRVRAYITKGGAKTA